MSSEIGQGDEQGGLEARDQIALEIILLYFGTGSPDRYQAL
jgi:hypothetical protein